MGEWKEYLFSEIAEVVMGQSPSGESCNTNGNGIPLLNGPTEFTQKFPQPVQFTSDAKKLSKVGDILFCVRGSTTGRMNWANTEYAIGRGLAAIRHKTDNKAQYFIRGLLDYNLPLILGGATGSTFPNVSGEELRNLKILAPPTPRANCHSRSTQQLRRQNRPAAPTKQNLRAISRNAFQAVVCGG